MKKNSNVAYDPNDSIEMLCAHAECPFTVGERIRACRVFKELTIEEFAAKLEKSYEYVVAYENNRRNPKDDTLEKMADILGTTYNYLKYGYVQSCKVTDDNMLEFEYRDKPIEKFSTKEYTEIINKSTDIITKNIGKTRMNYLPVLADMARFLAAISNNDVASAHPNDKNKKDIFPELLSLEEYKESLKKK